MSTVTEELRPFLREFLKGEPPVQIRFWDGSALGSGPAAIVLKSPRALRRLIYAPGELGFGRAYVAGDIDIEDDIYEVLKVRDGLARPTEHLSLRLGLRAGLRLLSAAARVGALGLPPAPPREEAHLKGPLHSKERDAAAIAHHYNVGNDFYRLVLGETMTYSCAYFERDDATLDEAQIAKYELISRKLGLAPGMRLLDVGCGWGGMAIHAARRHGVSVVGVTLSHPQADLAAKRVAEAGLADRVEIRYQDYRDVTDGPFHAISSIGMFEHVGMKELGRYFGVLKGLLAPGGRLLNHAISRPMGRGGFDRNSFVARYVFPDGELLDVGSVASAMQEQGLEVRDVESLREHYARTLRAWVSNLERNWDEAVARVGLPRAKIWRLYMAGSALAFEAGRINVHQVLGVNAHPEGASGMPPTRAPFVTATT
ncbi:MAG TPA: cyclopropane-fatty-acyl-phospholipid synthase family protein [Actinomycetota bacterium]|nr:cyclopropane-fatty-acyl-phospholipid synthase family protein [Actinomycetota bacterium]